MKAPMQEITGLVQVPAVITVYTSRISDLGSFFYFFFLFFWI